MFDTSPGDPFLQQGADWKGPSHGQPRKIRYALHEKKEAFVMFNNSLFDLLLQCGAEWVGPKHIFENLEKCGRRQFFVLLLITTSDFTIGSEQTYRGGARARAPRVSQNQNGPEGQCPAHEDLCSEPLWSRIPFFFTLRPPSITVPWVLFMYLTHNT